MIFVRTWRLQVQWTMEPAAIESGPENTGKGAPICQVNYSFENQGLSVSTQVAIKLCAIAQVGGMKKSKPSAWFWGTTNARSVSIPRPESENLYLVGLTSSAYVGGKPKILPTQSLNALADMDKQTFFRIRKSLHRLYSYCGWNSFEIYERWSSFSIPIIPYLI